MVQGRKNLEREIFMSNRKNVSKTAGILLAVLLLCCGMTAMAAPAVKGDTDLTVTEGGAVSAEYTITNDEAMESVTLTLSYDKEVLTYVSGSGGDSFSGSGGNGSVTLGSRPQDTTASFSVRFKGRKAGETQIGILSCKAVVDGTEVDVLSGGSSSEEGEEPEDVAEDDQERAGFEIDKRMFYVHRPPALDDFDAVTMEIQGIESPVLKHQWLDLYVIRLNSDNGSFRDDFVYDPDRGTVIPFVEMESGTDDVIFIEPEENGYTPTRYVPVELGWGPKYRIPALKHVIIDGVDEIPDDTNRYLIYGINQEGEKAWYSFDYDKNSLQLFDDVAYQGEQTYILELEEKEMGLREDGRDQLERYDRDMGRRLYIIMFMTIIIVVLLNVIVLMYLRMKRMRMPDSEDETEPSDDRRDASGAFVTGDLDEDETDFQEPDSEDDEEEEIDLEIIDLDDAEEDE